jgi:hypothetical protein
LTYMTAPSSSSISTSGEFFSDNSWSRKETNPMVAAVPAI